MPPGAAPFFRVISRVRHVEIRCPFCGRLHVDREEWAHQPHHTHLCEHCDAEFDRGSGHNYESGAEPFTIRGRALALVHKAHDVVDYMIATVTTKW